MFIKNSIVSIQNIPQTIGKLSAANKIFNKINDKFKEKGKITVIYI